MGVPCSFVRSLSDASVTTFGGVIGWRKMSLFVPACAPVPADVLFVPACTLFTAAGVPFLAFSCVVPALVGAFVCRMYVPACVLPADVLVGVLPAGTFPADPV